MDPHKFQPTTLFPTLDEARKWLQQWNQTGPGAICPCCNQLDKVYNRPINVSCIKVLFNLYRYTQINGAGYYHYRIFNRTAIARDFTCFLRLLYLIERAQNTEEKQKTSGMYAITERGIDFVENKISIPERLLVYHDELLRTIGENKWIGEFWPTFDYEQLMSEDVAA